VGGLTLDGKGNLYGTSSAGGAAIGYRTVFQLNSASVLTTLHRAGAYNWGTLFEITPN
jgi:uncharacterized repeat protein (TIGR03803 family)